MPYQIPSLEKLQEFIKTLRAKYTEQNPDRLQIISRLEKLSAQVKEPHGNRVLIGALFYYSSSIRYYFGSSLVTLLNSGPHNQEQKPLTVKDKFICLSEFFHFCNSNNLYLDFAEHKENIEEFNRAKLKPLTDPLAANLKSEMEYLFQCARIVNVDRRIAALPAAYRKFKSEHPPSYISTFRVFDYSDERYACIALTELLKAPLLTELLPRNCHTEIYKQQYEFTIRGGFLLYIMKRIPSQYYWTSPENSATYALCMQIFGTGNINEVPLVDQRVYISNFNDFIQRAKDMPEAIKALNEFGAFNKTTAKDFLQQVSANINKDFKGIVVPIITTCLILSATSLTQLMIGLQLSKAAHAIWQLEYGKGLLPLVLANAGALIGGKTGGAIGTYTGQLYEGAVLPGVYKTGLSFGFYQGISTVKKVYQNWDKLSFAQMLELMYSSGESEAQQEAKAREKFNIELQRKLHATSMKDSRWLHTLVDQIEFIQAMRAFCPEETIKLQHILDATEVAQATASPKKIGAPTDGLLPDEEKSCEASDETLPDTEEMSRALTMRLTNHF